MAFLIPAILFQGVYSGIIGTISAFTINTCGVIKSIYTHKNPNINKLLVELDIEKKLCLVESVVRYIKENKIDEFNDDGDDSNVAKIKLDDLAKTQIFELVGKEVDLAKDPIELCLTFLNQTIQSIHQDLSTINKKIADHKKKWFSNWRTLGVKKQIASLRVNSKLLTERFNDLTKIYALLCKQK